jgi:hypothetical protein
MADVLFDLMLRQWIAEAAADLSPRSALRHPEQRLIRAPTAGARLSLT